MKIFYDHLVYREEISAELAGYELTVDEREEIERLADETLHHEVLNIILEKLPESKHKKFLSQFHKNPSDPQLLTELKAEIKDIEEEIQKVARKVKKEILAEIKRAKKS